MFDRKSSVANLIYPESDFFPYSTFYTCNQFTYWM